MQRKVVIADFVVPPLQKNVEVGHHQMSVLPQLVGLETIEPQFFQSLQTEEEEAK
jgi:hypothetical protein